LRVAGLADAQQGRFAHDPKVSLCHAPKFTPNAPAFKSWGNQTAPPLHRWRPPHRALRPLTNRRTHGVISKTTPLP
jgi:hypothetical protein